MADEPNADHEKLVRIQECEKRVATAEDVVTDCAAELKAAKANFDAVVKALRAEIRNDETQTKLDFGKSPDAWRDESVLALVSYGVTDGDVTRLAVENIDTLGGISTYRDNKLLTGIDGIGEKGAERIEDALQGYFAAHVSTGVEPAEEPDTPDEESDNAAT